MLASLERSVKTEHWSVCTPHAGNVPVGTFAVACKVSCSTYFFFLVSHGNILGFLGLWGNLFGFLGLLKHSASMEHHLWLLYSWIFLVFHGNHVISEAEEIIRTMMPPEFRGAIRAEDVLKEPIGPCTHLDLLWPWRPSRFRPSASEYTCQQQARCWPSV